MIVTVVGATGVLGRSLIPRLMAMGHQVKAIAREKQKIMAIFGDRVEAVGLDLLEEGVDQRLPGVVEGSEAVYHIATAIPPDFNAPGAWERNTQLRTRGTRSLIDASLEVGVGVYLQQSIEMAYPDMGDEWIDESVPLDRSPGRAGVNEPVIEMEGLVKAIPEGQMRWCILRGGTFVGPGTFQDRTIRRLQAGEERVPCDGRAFVPYVHVEDVARAFALALEKAPEGAILNINAEPVRQGEYLDHLAEMNGAAGPKGDLVMPCPPSWRCSSRAAKEVLGWEAEEEIIHRPWHCPPGQVLHR